MYIDALYGRLEVNCKEASNVNISLTLIYPPPFLNKTQKITLPLISFLHIRNIDSKNYVVLKISKKISFNNIEKISGSNRCIDIFFLSLIRKWRSLKYKSNFYNYWKANARVTLSFQGLIVMLDRTVYVIIILNLTL